MRRIRMGRVWSGAYDRCLPGLMGAFLLGTVLGTLLALVWPSGLWIPSEWQRMLAGERLPYGRVLLRTLRFPVLLCLCACARMGRRLVRPALCLRGALLSYAVGCLLLQEGIPGFFLAVQLLLFHGFLPLPLLFFLALRCCALREPLPVDGALLRRLLAVGAFCVLCAGADWMLAPAGVSLLRWISG